MVVGVKNGGKKRKKLFYIIVCSCADIGLFYGPVKLSTRTFFQSEQLDELWDSFPCDAPRVSGVQLLELLIRFGYNTTTLNQVL
jgi:hypothetical protein